MAIVGARPVRSGGTPDRRPGPDGGQRLEAVRPRPGPRSATTSAAAPSLAPQALPAVMLKPSISGCSGLSAASFSMLVSRRGCSSTAKVRRVPSRPLDLEREDLVGEAAVVDGGDGPLVRAQRPRVHLLAGDAGLDGGVPADRDRHVHVGGARPVAVGGRQPGVPVVGARAPGASSGATWTTTGRRRRRPPVHAGADVGGGGGHGRQAGGAVPVVGQPGDVVEARPRWRRSGRCHPRRRATRRARRRRSRDGSTPDRRTASATACVPSSNASTSRSVPLKAVPIAVRAVDTTTASAIATPLSCVRGTRSDRGPNACARRHV